MNILKFTWQWILAFAMVMVVLIIGAKAEPFDASGFMHLEPVSQGTYDNIPNLSVVPKPKQNRIKKINLVLAGTGIISVTRTAQECALMRKIFQQEVKRHLEMWCVPTE